MCDLGLRAVSRRGSRALFGGALCAGLRLRPDDDRVQAPAAGLPSGTDPAGGGAGGSSLLRRMCRRPPVSDGAGLLGLPIDRPVRASRRFAGAALPGSERNRFHGEVSMLAIRDARATMVMIFLLATGCSLNKNGISVGSPDADET